jgi:hypothetical protein
MGVVGNKKLKNAKIHSEHAKKIEKTCLEQKWTSAYIGADETRG